MYVFLHGSVVLGLAWGSVKMLEDLPASTIHAIWSTAFGVLLLLPVGSVLVPGWTIDLTVDSSSSSSTSFFVEDQDRMGRPTDPVLPAWGAGSLPPTIGPLNR